MNYQIKKLRNSEYSKMYKEYSNGIKVDNYPNKEGLYTPHITMPYPNQQLKSLLLSIGMMVSKSPFSYGERAQIQFPHSQTKVLHHSISTMESLEKIVLDIIIPNIK
jgi:hypothetical protein